MNPELDLLTINSEQPWTTMIGVRNLEPGTRNPETGIRSPETGNRKSVTGTRKPDIGNRNPETGNRKPEARTRNTESKCLSRLSVFQEAKSRALALAGKLDCPTDPHFIKNIISVRNFS
jgi:hypothetical protein